MTALRRRRHIATTNQVQVPPPDGLGRLVSLALSICLILAPSNLFLKFDQVNWAVRGLRIDYLLPKLYLSDIALVITLGLALLWQYYSPLSTRFKLTNFWTFGVGGLVVAWLLRQFFTPYPIAAVVGAIRLLSYVWLWWQIQPHWTELKHGWLWWALVLSLVSQSALALFQFAAQRSLGSYRLLLGEPDLAHTYGIVHGNFGQWGELILPYGTTAHPNVLAGWVVGGWLLLLAWWQGKLVAHRWWLNMILFAVTLLTGEVVWLTQSWSAAGLAATGLLWLGWNSLTVRSVQSGKQLWLKILLVLGLFSSPWWTKVLDGLPWLSLMTQRSLSWDRRVWLAEAAVKLWQEKPWLGVGINQFTAYLETVTHQTELVRFVQPAHHVGWLWLSETGLLGMALLVGLGWLVQQRDKDFWSRWTIWLWVALPLLIWDHYLLTLPTGLWLSWWWLMPKTIPSSQPNLPKYNRDHDQPVRRRSTRRRSTSR